jgi:hypothetical protein
MMPKFGSAISRKVSTTGMSGRAQGMARMPRTNPRPRKLQLSSIAMNRPTISMSTTTTAVKTRVTRTTCQKIGSATMRL